MIEIYTQNIDDTWFAVALKGQQVVASSFGDSQQTTIRNVLGNVPFDVPFQVFHHPITYARDALDTLRGIYEGKDVEINLPLATTNLSAYTKRVLKTTMQIPLGYVTSYGSIAKAAGGGPRAIGNIMAGNRFAPIVPCHRVVKSDFTLGGYGFGLSVKLKILQKEKRGYAHPKEIHVDGGSFTAYPVEFVLKNFV